MTILYFYADVKWAYKTYRTLSEVLRFLIVSLYYLFVFTNVLVPEKIIFFFLNVYLRVWLDFDTQNNNARTKVQIKLINVPKCFFISKTKKILDFLASESTVKNCKKYVKKADHADLSTICLKSLY